ARDTNKSFFRHLMSGSLRLMVRGVLNVRVKDTQCGFKMYTQEAAQRLSEQQLIHGFSFDLETLYLAQKFGYKIAEVPVEWMDSPGSKVDAKKEAIRFIKDMARIRYYDFMRYYEGNANPLPVIDVTNPVMPEASAGKKLLSVAVVSPYPPSMSSLNEYGYHFIEALRQKHDEVGHVYILTDTLPDGDTYPAPPDDGVPMTIMPCWEFGARDNALKIRSAVKVIQPDMVLFNIQFASFAGTRVAGALGLLAPLMVKRLGIPTIVLLHNIMETVDLKSAGFGGSSIMETITRKAGEIATRAVLQADLVALTIPKYVDILREKYDAKNVFLAPHGAFDDVPEPQFSDYNNGTLNIMTFGKFGTYKKVEPLIEAYCELKSRTREQRLELVIAGSDSPNAKGYLSGVQEMYANVEGVTYTGYVAEEDVPRIFSEADVVVFPYTSTTGSSGVLHQAGSFGRSTVLPNFGDFAEVIKEEGYTGEFFEPENVESLAEAIDSLLTLCLTLFRIRQ
ncbi:MAG: glycosyltransferase, partial [Chloroflexota bacterium]